MTNNSAEQMRQLIEAVDHVAEPIEEAKPFSLLAQLKTVYKGLGNPSATKTQVQLNNYANTLYSQWQRDSQLLQRNRAGGQPLTANDFITWYGKSGRESGRADPAHVNLVRAAMNQLGIKRDQPMTDDQLASLVKQIAKIVLTQHYKVSSGLLNNASEAEEQQVFALFGKIDDWILRNKNRLSLKVVAQIINRILQSEGVSDKDAKEILDNAFADTVRATPQSYTLPQGRNKFNQTNATILSKESEISDLLRALPILLHKVIKAKQDLGLTGSSAAQPTLGAGPPAAQPKAQPTPADVAASFNKWNTTLQPLGFSADEIRRIVDREIFGTPTP